MTYPKPHLTYEQQLELLRSRGVLCDDHPRALRVLAANGYYNVSGYLYPFRLPDPSGGGRLDQVRPGTCFEDVIRLIDFDRQLRSHLLQGAQVVEVGIRARIAYVLGRRNPFGHTTTANLDPITTSRRQSRRGRCC